MKRIGCIDVMSQKFKIAMPKQYAGESVTNSEFADRLKTEDDDFVQPESLDRTIAKHKKCKFKMQK